MYLIDTSVWIPALRKDGPKAIQERITRLVSNNEATITGVIKIELLSGCRTEQEAKKLSERLKGIASISLREEDFEQAAEAAFRLRRSGETTPVPDLLIALAASVSGNTLVHADSDFERIATVLPFQRMNLVEEVDEWRTQSG